MAIIATYPEKIGDILKVEGDKSRGLSRSVRSITSIANSTNTVNLAKLGHLISTTGYPLKIKDITTEADIAGVLVHLDTPFDSAGTKNNSIIIKRDAILAGNLYLTNGVYTGSTAKADGSGNTTATLDVLEGITTFDEDYVAGTFTAQADNGDGDTRFTDAGHGLVTGQEITISGTNDYDGDHIVTVISSSQFDVVGLAYVTDEATGTWALTQATSTSDGEFTSLQEIETALSVINSWLVKNKIRTDFKI